MENASKALIIAGAILLSILLISLGIMIFSQAQDTVTNSGMSDAEISAFNNRFIKYEGDRKGTVVKTLIQEVIASNANDDNEGQQILIHYDKVETSSGDKSAFQGKADNTVVKGDNGTEYTAEEKISSTPISTTKSYTVEVEAYTGGCISVIKISD